MRVGTGLLGESPVVPELTKAVRISDPTIRHGTMSSEEVARGVRGGLPAEPSAPSRFSNVVPSTLEDILAQADELPNPELVSGSPTLNSLDDMVLAAEDAARFNRAPTAFPESIAPASMPRGEFTLPGDMQEGAVASLDRLSPRQMKRARPGKGTLRSPREVSAFGNRLDSFIQRLRDEGSLSNFGR